MNENKWARPPGTLERPFGPICASLTIFALWRHMAVPTYFVSFIWKSSRFYITYQKMEEIGPIPGTLWPFESTPGHGQVRSTSPYFFILFYKKTWEKSAPF